MNIYLKCVCRATFEADDPRGCPNCGQKYVAKQCVADRVEAILKARGNRYGNAAEQSRVFVDIVDAVGKTGKVSSMPPIARQSLYMIALKMSRIVCGDPMDPDSWQDIEGYAKLPFRDHTDD